MVARIMLSYSNHYNVMSYGKHCSVLQYGSHNVMHHGSHVMKYGSLDMAEYHSFLYK